MTTRKLNKEKLLVAELLMTLKKAKEHLEYCGYGDRWERECAHSERLPELIDAVIEKGDKFFETKK